MPSDVFLFFPALCDSPSSSGYKGIYCQFIPSSAPPTKLAQSCHLLPRRQSIGCVFPALSESASHFGIYSPCFENLLKFCLLFHQLLSDAPNPILLPLLIIHSCFQLYPIQKWGFAPPCFLGFAWFPACLVAAISFICTFLHASVK